MAGSGKSTLITGVMVVALCWRSEIGELETSPGGGVAERREEKTGLGFVSDCRSRSNGNLHTNGEEVLY